MAVTQSAYRQYLSTETAVMKVQNDRLLAAEGDVSALCLRDLTTAFDPVVLQICKLQGELEIPM